MFFGDVEGKLKFININFLLILYKVILMVQAIININQHSNRILNIVKAKFGLRDKSEAIEKVILSYEEGFLEPNLRPEYVEKAKEIMKEKPIDVGTVTAFREKLEI
jgi:hypothetical protein